MEERNKLVRRALERDFVDQADAGASGPGQLPGNVIRGKSHVVNALPSFFEKGRDGTVRRRGFEEFKMRAANVKKRRSHLLRGNLFDALAGQTKRLFVILRRLRHGANGDAKVIDFQDHL